MIEIISLKVDSSKTMSNPLSFDKVINDFFIEIELTCAQPNYVSFILVQDKHQQCYELKLADDSLPQDLQILFGNVRKLYNYLLEMQDNRNCFDISMNGHLIIKKTVGNCSRIVSIPTTIAKVKDPYIQENHLVEQCKFEGNQHDKFRQNVANHPKNVFISEQQTRRKCEAMCLSAQKMIKDQYTLPIIARTLRLRQATVSKMFQQMKKYGRIIPPNKHSQPNPQQFIINKPLTPQEDTQNYTQQSWQQSFKSIGPITPNMKMHGQSVRGIKKLLYVLVKEGKMQSLDQMRNFLLERKIDRSLSSIYRYISSIKTENPQFQSRNYTMYRKDTDQPDNN